MSSKIHIIIFFCFISIAIAVIYFHPPMASPYYPPCIAKKITGYDCAGCGSARACYNLLHGKFVKAADNNILLVALLPVIAIGLIHFFTGRLSLAWKKINKPLLFLWVIVCFWVIRNIPAYPFTILHSDY